MSMERLIKDVQHIADCCYQGSSWAQVLREAIDKLRTHQDNQPNEPLTLEELRARDGKPVWIYRLEDGQGWWIIARISNTKVSSDYGGWFGFDDYGKTWLAYDRPPKEA